MSRTAKLGLAVVLGVIVVVALAWASVQSLAGDGPEAATSAFFKTIADKGAQAAYATTSPTFQRATPVDAFTAAVQARGLSDYRASDWTVRGRQGDLAELSGAVNLKGGGVVPAEVRVVKGQSGWQVLSLELPQGGLSGGAAAPVASDAGNDMGGYDSASPAPPATDQGGAPANAPQAPVGAPAGLIAPPPTGAPAYPPQAAGDAAQPNGQPMAGPEISRSRVARICGKTLMQNSWAESIQLHCPTGIGAAPGSTTRCLAIVNGHRTGLTATMDRYDSVRDDAQLTCRLD